MPLDTPARSGIAAVQGDGDDVDPERAAEVARLNAQLRHHSATDVIRTALERYGNMPVVSSFGAESVALLHLAAMVDRDIEVIFIDTRLLFTETLVYQQEVAERLGLRNLCIVTASDIDRRDPTDTLHRTDPDACCTLRKTDPLRKALQGKDGWITGRKRFQSGTRASMAFFEVEPDSGRIKVNPLAFWQPGDVADYIAENRLPRHPLVAKGYPSIGCFPCTSPVAAHEDSRAGRWRNSQKEECGIHFADGKLVRTGETR